MYHCTESRKRADGFNRENHLTTKHKLIPGDNKEEQEGGEWRGEAGERAGAGKLKSTGAPTRGRKERNVAEESTTRTTTNGNPTRTSGTNLRETSAPPLSSENPRSPPSLTRPISCVLRERRRGNSELHETESTGSGTTRPRAVADRQRPKSAGAAAGAVSMLPTSSPNQRRRNSGRERQQRFVLPGETPAATPGEGAFEGQRKKIVAGGKRRQNVAGERVIPACWSVDRTPARRPPPLGKTNAPTTAEKVVKEA